ncbi:MAG: D-alanine--D-alanine ligase family protein [Bacillota bacterium]|nr:D-alanine--D-alanine ligase [Candidatus Fermentithermobacillaceae bacterium]
MLRLGVVFGGRSGEHEVSVMSADSVVKAARQAGFAVEAIGVTRKGQWVYLGDGEAFFAGGNPEVLTEMGPACCLLPDPDKKGIWVNGEGTMTLHEIDVVFPVLHGPHGEDGSLQGLLELSGIPYVGAPVLASAVCMDKDTTKRLLASCGVPHVTAIPVERHSWRTSRQDVLDNLLSRVRFPLFTKPSGSGSSLGVTKVKRPEDLAAALDQAFLYDTKALVEPSMDGCLEVECSVLGNEEPVASIAGQILPRREFYDYEAKYIEDTTALAIPAALDPEMMARVQEVAVAAFRVTGCRGMARVDFFVDLNAREAYVNELNTIPGFTRISMYPKMWEASGLSFPELVRKLVTLALDRQSQSWREVYRRS